MTHLPARTHPVKRNGRPRKRRSGAGGLTPKVERAINLMIFGGDDGLPMERKDAAAAAGLADVSLKQALAKPMVLKHYNGQMEVLRTSERPRSFQRVVKLRDGAKSEQVQFRAARFILEDGQRAQNGVNVNVGLNITPGYVIDLRPIDEAERAKQISHLVDVTPKALEHKASVPTEGVGTPDLEGLEP